MLLPTDHSGDWNSLASEKEHAFRMAILCEEVANYHAEFGKMPYDAPGKIPRLDRIVGINPFTLTAVVEANVRMDSLVEATSRLGLLPSVVAGERGMTVADAFANLTSESSSFAFGTFDCTVVEIEVILGDGKLVRARSDWNDDLFYGSAGTMNSLGLVTMLEISLTRRGPYVALEFIRLSLEEIGTLKATLKEIRTPPSKDVPSKFKSLTSEEELERDASVIYTRSYQTDHQCEKATFESEVIAHLLWQLSGTSVEFVEAVMFKQLSGVIVGRTGPINCSPLLESSEAHSFTEIVRDKIEATGKNRKPQVFYMETAMYLFRHDSQHMVQTRASYSEGNVHLEPLSWSKAIPQSFGVCIEGVERLVKQLQDRTAVPLRIRPVLSPRMMDRRASSGIGHAFPLSNELYFIIEAFEVSQSGVLDRILDEDYVKSMDKGGSGRRDAFQLLHSYVPCPKLVAPWYAHDYVAHGKLRKKWRAGVFPDVLDRLETRYQPSSIDPACAVGRRWSTSQVIMLLDQSEKN
jgi:hypothetical protein